MALEGDGVQVGGVWGAGGRSVGWRWAECGVEVSGVWVAVGGVGE